ncbi:uncharacterized protein ARMOST_04247 [Armillaria ostoyae]|uniref:Uncharacterized protein n=1 Tax=Armillaria ostoyae TaxID=47428 RepID=A0A284QWU7_ARMOS|nr:uncharacterized protein ARMOST_04247 [Armillaria ostoyae]
MSHHRLGQAAMYLVSDHDDNGKLTVHNGFLAELVNKTASMDAMKRHIFPRLLGVFGDLSDYFPVLDSASVPRRWFGSVRGLVFDRDIVGDVTRGRAEGERSIGDGLANVPAEDSGTCYLSRVWRCAGVSFWIMTLKFITCRREGGGWGGIERRTDSQAHAPRPSLHRESSGMASPRSFPPPNTGIDDDVLWPYFTSGFMLMTIEEESETWRTAAMVDGVGRSGEDNLAQCEDGEYDSVMTETRVLIEGLQLDKYKILEDECHTELEFVEVQKH